MALLYMYVGNGHHVVFVHALHGICSVLSALMVEISTTLYVVSTRRCGL